MPNSLSLQPPRLTFVVCCLLFPPPLFFWHFSKDGPKEPTRKPDERLWKQKSCSLTRGTRATPARKIQFVPALHRQVSGRQEVREGVGKVLRRVSKRNKTLRTDGNDFPSIRIFLHILKKKQKKRFLSDYFLKIHVMWNECMQVKTEIYEELQEKSTDNIKSLYLF